MAAANSITVTALALIKASGQEIGVLAPGEIPSNEDQTWILEKLQRLIDQYNARETMIYNVNFTQFVLPTGPNPVTIGPGGQFDVNQRPVSIESIGLILPGTPGVELPLNKRDQDWWANNRIKGLTSTLPTDFYYSQDWPLGQIFFWPVPQGNFDNLVYQTISTQVPMGAIDGTNTVFTLTIVPSGSLLLFNNGILQTQGVDYTLSGLTITFFSAPTGTLLAQLISGTFDNGTFITTEQPFGPINGVNQTYTLSNIPTGVNSLFLNGVYQTLNIDYSLNGKVITFFVAPSGADIIRDTYVYGSGTPGSGQYQVNIQTRQVLGEFTTYIQAFSMPPAYWNLIVYELAISIAPSFEREPSSTLIGLWKAALKAVTINNISSPRLASDSPTTGNQSGRPDFNFLEGLTR